MTGASACLVGVGISGAGSGSGFSASAPALQTGFGSGAAASGIVSTSSITVTVSGGTPPYTYLCARRSGDASISVLNSTTATPYFSATVSNASTPKDAIFGVTVTDSLGAGAVSNDIEVYLEWDDTR